MTIHREEWVRLERRVADLALDIKHIMRKLDMASQQLTDLRQAVASLTTVNASAVAAFQGLAQKIRDAGEADDPKAIEDLATQVNDQAGLLAKAVTDNTSQATSGPGPQPGAQTAAQTAAASKSNFGGSGQQG